MLQKGIEKYHFKIKNIFTALVQIGQVAKHQCQKLKHIIVFVNSELINENNKLNTGLYSFCFY